MLDDGVSISTSVGNNAINSARWSDMNFNELLDQKNIMFDRYEFMVRMGNAGVAKSLLEGINTLDSLIAQKALK